MEQAQKQAGVDWQGLFNWSMQQHDGTAPSRPDIQPMSEEDAKWL